MSWSSPATAYPSTFFNAMEAQYVSSDTTVTRQDFATGFIVNTVKTIINPKNTVAVDNDNDDPSTVQDTLLIPEKSHKRKIKEVLIFSKFLSTTVGIGLNLADLITRLTSEVIFPPLEFVWLISCSKYKLFEFSAYLMRLPPSYQKFLGYQLIQVGFSPQINHDSTKRKCTQLVAELLPELIIAGYANPESTETLLELATFARHVLSEVNERLLSDDCSRWNRQLILALLEGVLLPASIKHKFSVAQIRQLLLQQTEEKGTLEKIHRNQESFAGLMDLQCPGKWARITSILTQIPSSVIQDVLVTCQKYIEDQSINWESILVFITIATTNTPSLFPVIKTVIRDLLIFGLKTERKNILISSFLLARHCSLISPGNFDRYEIWYSAVFGNATSPAWGPDEFRFLASVLSEMVPDEPMCFLQVHITYWPFVPVGMRPVWHDYVQLAKCRNTPCDGDGDDELNPNNPIHHDLDRILRSFSTRNRIPEAISEMLMFRKRYYYDEFLPALLRKPYDVPISDEKSRLIEALQAGGKIPAELYAKYKCT